MTQSSHRYLSKLTHLWFHHIQRFSPRNETKTVRTKHTISLVKQHSSSHYGRKTWSTGLSEERPEGFWNEYWISSSDSNVFFVSRGASGVTDEPSGPSGESSCLLSQYKKATSGQNISAALCSPLWSHWLSLSIHTCIHYVICYLRLHTGLWKLRLIYTWHSISCMDHWLEVGRTQRPPFGPSWQKCHITVEVWDSEELRATRPDGLTPFTVEY